MFESYTLVDIFLRLPGTRFKGVDRSGGIMVIPLNWTSSPVLDSWRVTHVQKTKSPFSSSKDDLLYVIFLI